MAYSDQTTFLRGGAYSADAQATPLAIGAAGDKVKVRSITLTNGGLTARTIAITNAAATITYALVVMPLFSSDVCLFEFEFPDGVLATASGPGIFASATYYTD